ncbi:MAG TPA: hypothetical protein VNZ06_02785 [Steroidobacteraceae bacterium]|nr:hypothetical protein [Steroidobacteraceae bacterium]
MERKRARTLGLLCAFAATLAALSGCSDLAVALGLRVRLDKIPVTGISARLVSNRDARVPVSALGPGQSARLIIVATDSAGKTYVTVGAGGGKVALNNYSIATEVAQIRSSKVSLSTDPTISEGKIGKLYIAPVAHPEVTTELDVPVRYDLAYRANFSAGPGADGFDGASGISGSPGFDALQTTDPTTGLTSYQGAGGSGGDGTRGSDGGDGQDGSPGGQVQVWMRLSDLDPSLLQVKAVSGSKQSLFLIDPNGGSLQITADGGSGGRGGRGGPGGQGGRGGAGSPSGLSGNNGLPGSDGRGGRVGAAGSIAISVDPAAESYLKALTWSNKSGDGIPGPAPSITFAPVPPLW